MASRSPWSYSSGSLLFTSTTTIIVSMVQHYQKLCDDALILVLRLLGCEELQRCRLVCRRWRDLVQHRDVWRHRALGLLPNSFLVRVLQHLGVSTLLRCRLVCRRWRDLAVHPNVWRHRVIPSRLLRLPPPCCDKLFLSYYDRGDYLSLAATAMCPATDVQICLKVGEANKALQVVRHQAGLGSLKSLVLIVRDETLYNKFDVVLSVEGLRNLEVRQFCNEQMMSLIENPCLPAALPSLRKLRYWGGPDRFLESLLQALTLNLEDFNLGYRLEFDKFYNDLTVAGLLSKCSNLRKLSCPFLGGFEQLLACRSLTHLSIVVSLVEGADEEEARCAISSLCRFLRSAAHLNHLDFYFHDHPFEWVTDLFRALGDAGRSQITTLEVERCFESIDWTKEQADRLWELVVPILPNFPRLEELVVNVMVTSHLLKAIRPNVLPNVTRLTFGYLDPCLNCNCDLLCEMLQIYPKLQINIELDNIYACYQCSKTGFQARKLFKKRSGYKVNTMKDYAAKYRVNIFASAFLNDTPESVPDVELDEDANVVSDDSDSSDSDEFYVDDIY